ncbi:hypothetical protein J6590_019762 [Homalodisca vitripennis]|nr:hypothetical protein J6590_019762 [Homalodisca vitripennis]
MQERAHYLLLTGFLASREIFVESYFQSILLKPSSQRIYPVEHFTSVCNDGFIPSLLTSQSSNYSCGSLNYVSCMPVEQFVPVWRRQAVRPINSISAGRHTGRSPALAQLESFFCLSPLDPAHWIHESTRQTSTSFYYFLDYFGAKRVHLRKLS